MGLWLTISEVVKNIGIVLGGALGIYLAWKRVIASNKQAEAQLAQADSLGAVTLRSFSIGPLGSSKTKSCRFVSVQF